MKSPPTARQALVAKVSRSMEQAGSTLVVHKIRLLTSFVQFTIKEAFPWSRVPGAQKTKRMVEIVTCKVEIQMILLRTEMR